MIISLGLLLIILCVSPLSSFSFLQSTSGFLHKMCLERVETINLEVPEIYFALLCGERLPDGDLKKIFISLGIIHLMVISGSHLIFIEKTWSLLPRFRFKNLLLTLFLLIYSMSAGLKPPVLRALFSLLLSKINREMKLFWSPYTRVFISGLLCLLFNNTWVSSLSLQLSWLASLGMSNHRISKLKSCFLTFIFLLPIISQWGGLSPLSIILNWLITPLVSGLLLPLSFLTLLFPFLHPLPNELWQGFIHISQYLQPIMENYRSELNWSLNFFERWIYICLLSILLQVYCVYSFRTSKS